MKRNHIRYMLLLLPVLLLAGCQDPMDDHGPDAPDGPATFTATIGSAATKTLLAGQAGGTRPVYWAADDSVCIGGAIYRVSSITATGSAQAVFTGNGAAKDTDGKYKAWYPASLYNKVLPAVQEYEAPVTLSGQTYPKIAHLPMYAESENTDLEFHNLCTVLDVRLMRSGNPPAKVTKVVVTSASKKLNGPFDVVEATSGAGDWYAKMKDGTPPTDAEKTVTLNCGTSGVNLNATTPIEFCIAIPAGDFPQYDLTIKVYNGDTEIASFTNLDAGTTNLGRSEMLDLVKSTTLSFSIKTPTNGYELVLPFVAYARLRSTVEVNWGDGKDTTYYSGSNATNLMKHVYAKDGDYDVTLKFLGINATTMPEMVFSNTAFRQVLTALTSPLPLLTNATGSALKTDADGMFTHCAALTAIHPDLFINNPQLTSFDCTFYKCSSLTTIPETLFAPCQNATNFHGTFSGCSSLKGPIPENLFENNTKAARFDYTFENCLSLTGPIPGNLFANNPEVTNFSYVFNNDSLHLDGPIPENLFANNTKVTSFEATFQNCSSLTGEIPGNLFANNTKVTSFVGTFSGCTQLKGPIPGNLFANNPEVTDFSYVFNNDSLHLDGPIPEDLFANNKKVESFIQTFYNCQKLQGPLPAGLFRNNKEVRHFTMTFCKCFKLDGKIPEGFFRYNRKAWKFEETFNSCHNLQISPYVFVDPTDSTPGQRVEDRFVGTGLIDLTGCFSYMSLDIGAAANPLGSVPRLWEYPRDSFVVINVPTARRPFQGIFAQDYHGIPIPEAWGGPSSSTP